jgi:hypothetical protein
LTKSGTSAADFQNLIEGIDGEPTPGTMQVSGVIANLLVWIADGQGVQIDYSKATFQGYVTLLNSSFAEELQQNSIVQTVVPDEEDPVLGDNDNGDPDLVQRRSDDFFEFDRMQPRPRASLPRANSGPPPPTNNLVRQAGSQPALQVISQGKANNLAGIREDVGLPRTQLVGDCALTLQRAVFIR